MENQPKNGAVDHEDTTSTLLQAQVGIGNVRTSQERADKATSISIDESWNVHTRTLLSPKSNTDESLDKHEQIHDRLLPDYAGMHLNEKQEPGGHVFQSNNSKMDDQIHAAAEYEDSVSQDIWIPPTTYKISSPKKEELLIKTINFPRDCVTKVSPEEELSILFDELKFILENDAYDESLRKSLQESYPEYLKIIEKRKNDLLKDDHGIVIAGEPSAGKSTLTNKLLQKRIFKCRKKESTSTLCTIRNSEDIRIITEGTNGERQTISLPSTCNIETESGQKLLRDTLKNLTSSQESKHFRSIDVGFPIPFLKGNTIIIDAPGIDDSGDFTKKLMDYLPNAVSFIFVIDVNRLGCMHDEKLAGILRSLINLQIEDEMPCFDPKEVIFITNKWDTIARDGSHDKESSDKNQDEKIWNELKNAIKTIWPFVKDENIFKMSLKNVSSKETNASTTSSTEEFKNFWKSLNRVILESERTRLVQHLRFLQDFLNNIRKGIDSRLALGKRSGEEQRALEEKHHAKMKELKTKCVEEGRKLLEDIKKMIQDEAEEIYDYMSSDLGKDKILNPPGHMNLMDIQYIPSRLEKKVKGRVEMYVQGVLHSEKIQEKFLILRRKTLDFYTEVSSDISEIEGEWTNNSEGAHHEDCQEVSMAPYMTGVIASSPLWIPALAVGIGLVIATLGVGFVASPIIAPVLVILLRKERRRKIIDKEYEYCMQTIQSTICNHLKIMYGDVLEKLIKKISTDILPRRIKSLEKLIRELSENRQRILANQLTLASLSKSMKLIEERKVEIEMSITLIKQIDRSESTLDKKAVLKEFEGWLRKKYKDIKIVHLYIGKQINGLKDTLVVVIDNVDVIEEKTFDYCGKMFDLCFKLWMRPSSECMRICKFENEHWHKIKDVKLAEIEQSLKMCSTSLFDEHSNLEIVSASAYRSKKNGENIIFEPCIVLYCSCKGVVPYKEKEFPKQIMGRNTDVREGFFYLFPNDRYFKRASDVLDPLMIGASIGRKDENKEGTLGGFVTLNNGEVGIITCGHVLYDFSTNVSPQTTAVEVVQPSYGYRNTNNVCGVHIKSILEIHQGVTVDASLAKLTDRVPQRGLFAELMTNDLLGVGFSLENLPEYASGSTRDYRKENTKRTNLCIKFGARSGLTKGFLCVNGMTARCRDEQMYLTNPASGSTCLYRSQLEFGGIATKPFAVEGDSGALVFQVDPKSSEEEDDKLFCIGMVVGGTSYCTTVVTPIESILESLNVKMHVFPEESMEQL